MTNPSQRGTSAGASEKGLLPLKKRWQAEPPVLWAVVGLDGMCGIAASTSQPQRELA